MFHLASNKDIVTLFIEDDICISEDEDSISLDTLLNK